MKRPALLALALALAAPAGASPQLPPGARSRPDEIALHYYTMARLVWIRHAHCAALGDAQSAARLATGFEEIRRRHADVYDAGAAAVQARGIDDFDRRLEEDDARGRQADSDRLRERCVKEAAGMARLDAMLDELDQAKARGEWPGPQP